MSGAGLPAWRAWHECGCHHCRLGRGGPYRDIVVLNGAAALKIAGKVDNLKDGAAMALDAIMSGKAGKILAALVAVSNGKPKP